jgi:hypothetical protein
MKSGRNPSQKRRDSWKSWKSLLNIVESNVQCLTIIIFKLLDIMIFHTTGHHYYFHNDIQWLFMYLHCHLHHLLQAPLTMWKTPVFDTPWREIARSVWQETRLHIECQGDLYAIPSPFGDRKGIYQLWKTGHFLGIPWGYHGDTTDWQQKWLVGFVAVLACSETRPWP